MSKQTTRQDPEGGLTAAGRRHFAKTEGAHFKPGVTKPERDMSADEMKRKKADKLVDDDGEPPRYALQAQAWGERLRRTLEDVVRLADKGTRLLEKAAKR